ncbi:MAG: CPBP family intramembrane metalloprotease [Gemmataceae bacterium]|nr:CPBP family intramembrane metalloprotease [Gemmataceae bacterium]
MPRSGGEYLAAARHPWSCVFFVLPLLAAYEGGVLCLPSAQQAACRNGADLWLRSLISQTGLRQWFWAPLLLGVALLTWAWARRKDRPPELPAVWLGMVLECAALALGLWGACHILFPLLERLGMQISCATACDPAVEQLLGFVGAGIYEEALFRLLLFSVLAWLVRAAEFTSLPALALAAVLSALVFALAHHIGTQGETFQPDVFLFRTLAGLYFTGLYYFRGFGIAVGAHAGYDVLVGLLIHL